MDERRRSQAVCRCHCCHWTKAKKITSCTPQTEDETYCHVWKSREIWHDLRFPASLFRHLEMMVTVLTCDAVASNDNNRTPNTIGRINCWKRNAELCTIPLAFCICDPACSPFDKPRSRSLVLCNFTFILYSFLYRAASLPPLPIKNQNESLRCRYRFLSLSFLPKRLIRQKRTKSRAQNKHEGTTRFRNGPR